MSPYLFLIAIEIMAISIRTNENIEGIKIGEDDRENHFKFLCYFASEFIIYIVNERRIDYK